MPDPNEPFTPQFVDEQIEQITHTLEQTRQVTTPEAELLQDTQDLYRAYAGTRDRVRQRLQAHLAGLGEKSPQVQTGTFQSSSLTRQNRRKPESMQYIQKPYAQSRSIKPRLALVAATLLAAVLVVTLAVVVPLIRSMYAPVPASPGVFTSQPLPTTVYIGNSQGILKLDPRTGATLKSYPWPKKPPFTIGTVQPYALQMSGKLLYVGVNIINSRGSLFYTAVQALDPNTGTTRWIYYAPTDNPSTMTIANGLIYMSVDNPDTQHPASLVFALDASNGKEHTHYNVPEMVKDLTVAQGFLFAHSYGNLYGFNLSTHKSWQKYGPGGAEQGFTALQVVNGVLYTSAYQNGSGSYFVALHPDTGKQIWRSQAIPGKIFNFTISHNVIYFGTDASLPGISGQPGCYCDGRIDAYDIQQQKILWEQSAGSVAQTYAVTNGVVYAVISFPYPGGPVDPELIALSTTHGKLLWHKNAGAQGYRFEPIVSNGHLYIAGGTTDPQPGTLMYMLAPADGHVLWQKSFSATERVWTYTIIAGN